MASRQVSQFVELHQLLANHFNLEELQELCFILGVRYDDLGGQTLSAKTLALRTYMERRNRMPQLIEQLTILRPSVDWPAFISTALEAEPPFKGLTYFTEADADIFYGRQTLTAEIVSFLNDHRFLAVVGASGSGKSSLVRAGVVPAVRSGSIKLNEQTSASWPIHIITPGDEPLKALAASLTRQAESVTAMKALVTDMQADSQSLDLWLYRQFANQPDTRLVLVVDQFEELFTHCDDPLERSLFVENLAHAAQSGKQGRLTLIMTLRADFYAHAVQYEILRPLLETGQKIVGPMSAAELRQAIEGPAAAGDWQFQPGLVDLILRDLGATQGQEPEPGALPLLSHVLLETWRRREGQMMTLAGYQAAGGVHRAIAATADAVYVSLTPEQQAIVRHIFSRLTGLGKGTEDTRRRARPDELAPQIEDAPEVQTILQRLVDKRLVTISGESVEVAHEALIREWPRLRSWVDEDRAGLRIQQQLTEAAQGWLELDQDPGALYRGMRLVQAETWALESGSRLSELENRFLAESRNAIKAEERARQKAHQRAQRIPAYSLLGGASAFALSFLLVGSPAVENQDLLLVLTLLRLTAGGLAGFFLVFLVDLAVTRIGWRDWTPWLLGGLSGSLVFALLLYFDTLLRVSSVDATLPYAAAAGALWGLPAGLGRVWMLHDNPSQWRIILFTAFLCGLVLMLIARASSVFGDITDMATFLTGAVVPFGILMAAHLADSGEGR